MKELAQQLLTKDLAWLLGASILVLAVVILLWVVWKIRKNGNPARILQEELKLDNRITMLESDVREVKTLFQTAISYLTKDIEDLQTTSNRFGREVGVIADRLEQLTNRLNRD